MPASMTSCVHLNSVSNASAVFLRRDVLKLIPQVIGALKQADVLLLAAWMSMQGEPDLVELGICPLRSWPAEEHQWSG